MSNTVYPALKVRGLTWSVLKRPETGTILQLGTNKGRVAIQQYQNPYWHWVLLYEYLKNDPNDLPPDNTYTDYQTWLGYFLARGGQFDDFLFTDNSDLNNGQVCYIGPAKNGGTPNPQAQLQIISDGAGSPTYYSPIQRLWGGLFYEDITDLNGMLAVFDNGVLKALGTDYTIAGPGLAVAGYSFGGLYIQWASMPTGPVTVEGNYYYRVQFEMDDIEMEQFMNFLWTIGGTVGTSGSGMVKLCTARPVLV